MQPAPTVPKTQPDIIRVCGGTGEVFSQRPQYLPRGSSLLRFLAGLPVGIDQLVPVHQSVHAAA